MKARTWLGISITFIFVISHLLPAYGSSSGFECFRACGGALVDFKPDELLGWLYYGGFAVSNVLFVALVPFVFFQKQFPKTIQFLIVVLTLHVISWFPMGLETDRTIKIGYYLWLLAYLLLTYVILTARANRHESAA